MKLLCALALIALGLPFGSSFSGFYPGSFGGYGGFGSYGGFGGFGGGLAGIFGPGAYPGFYGITSLNLLGGRFNHIFGRFPPPPMLGAAERRGTLSPYPLDIRTTSDPVTGHPMVQVVYGGVVRERIVPVPVPVPQDVPVPVPQPIPQPYPVQRPIPQPVPVPVPHPVPIHTNTEVQKTDVVAATPGGPGTW